MHGMIIFLNVCSLVIVLISFRDHKEMEKTYKRKTKKIEFTFPLFYVNLYTHHLWWAWLAFLFGECFCYTFSWCFPTSNLLLRLLYRIDSRNEEENISRCPFGAMVESIQLARCRLQSPLVVGSLCAVLIHQIQVDTWLDCWAYLPRSWLWAETPWMYLLYCYVCFITGRVATC